MELKFFFSVVDLYMLTEYYSNVAKFMSFRSPTKLCRFGNEAVHYSEVWLELVCNTKRFLKFLAFLS